MPTAPVQDATEDEANFYTAAQYLASRQDLHLSNEIMLQFYALYKIATVGSCNVPKPGFFDFAGKAKWDAWASLGDLPKHEAMSRYVRLAAEHADWKPGESDRETTETETAPRTRPEKTGQSTGVSVSTMANDREEISDADKTIWNWAEEGVIEKVVDMIDAKRADVNQVDDQGLTLLHWAADRGYVELTKVLLERGASVDAQDNEGQTPLHYAAIIENEDIVRTLVAGGASSSIRDFNDETPLDSASEGIKSVIVIESSKLSKG
ncbi:hypothetical protein SpCBS45565_g00279 [Spizellomyces sp. 'palustris']|nr:hypothetical protein SpCBS45565_g00279 [Spizellomyces sp. 'palustris']